ncbi:MAG: 50S ribosomal protein L21 [Clostridiales bacterium]|jgi:large subunit ribosomal protein L21|nr:50S ribosomal protein L21 [Clostridiales bacterium]
MYAIIVSGGKQYRVEKDGIVKVERLDGQIGDKVKFDVLLFADGGNITAGNPLVEGAQCEAEIIEQGKGDKLVIFRYKAKKNVKKKQGHRQPFTAVKILGIAK